MSAENQIKTRNRRIAIVLAVSASMSVLFCVYGILQKTEASKQVELAESLKIELVKVREDVERAKQLAIAAQVEAEKQHKLAEETLLNCNKRK